MQRSLFFAGVALAAAVPLAGCASHVNSRVGVGWYSSPYSVWYDGYYGPFYDGYWGDNGYFYYRLSQHDRYRQAQGGHFYRAKPQRNDGSYRHFEGHAGQPSRGVAPPHYPSRERREHDRRDRRDDR